MSGIYIKVLIWVPILSIILYGCSTLDERDECCEEVTIHFRYSKGTMDEFSTHIHQMNYYIFDAGGRLLHHFVRSKEDGISLQTIKLYNVDAGRYRIVAVGNISTHSLIQFDTIGETAYQTLELQTQNNLHDKIQGDSDPLYYGTLIYEVKPIPIPQSFLCDMSNAHAKLIATIRWADTQPKDRHLPYTIELEEVSGTYSLANNYKIRVSGDGELVSTPEKVIHSFPMTWLDAQHPLKTHQKDAPYLAGRVRAEIRSLRYSDDLVPTLRVKQGENEIMGPIQLKKVFQRLKWSISDNIEQVYELEFTIYDSGLIEVRSGGQFMVLDWIDGGIIG